MFDPINLIWCALTLGILILMGFLMVAFTLWHWFDRIETAIFELCHVTLMEFSTEDNKKE